MKNINLFRDSESGEIFSYDDEQVKGGFVRAYLTPLSEAESEEHIQANTPKEKPNGNKEVELARLTAYAHPVTGSDRYQIEAAAERLSGNEEAAQAAEHKWISRRSEIAKELPWVEGN